MAERNTDVTTFSKTFQEKEKTFPCDPQDLFQIALLYIDFKTNARNYKEDLLLIALLEFVILIAHWVTTVFGIFFNFQKIKSYRKTAVSWLTTFFGVIFQ